MHKQNLNHSELYLLTTTLYLSNTPPPPTPTMNIDQSRSCLICGTSVAVGKKSNVAPPRWFSFWQNLHNTSAPLNSLVVPAYTAHEGQSFTVCVATCIYIYCTWRTHTHGVISTWDRGEMSPALFEIPFVSPPLYKYVYYFFLTQAVDYGLRTVS